MNRPSASTVTISAPSQLRVEQLEDRLTPGTGNFTGPQDNGQFNFAVSVRFNATAEQLVAIQAAFQNGSQILADATDGKHKFGEITIVNNSKASGDAEYWVFPGKGRAHAPLGQYGYYGHHATLYYNSDFVQLKGKDGDAYTVAHEFAHHAYGIADSYRGPNIPINPNYNPSANPQPGSLPAFNALPSMESPTLSFSLMDDFFTRGGMHESVPEADREYTLNEFSVESNHDNFTPGPITWQSRINQSASDWTTITESKYPATPPAGLPVDAAPPDHQVTFRQSAGDLVITAVLDVSGSMTPTRIANLTNGSRLLTYFLNPTDRFGVVSFSDAAQVEHGLAVGTPPNLVEAREKISGVVLGGATEITKALSKALDEIKALPASARSPSEVILLMTDGDHTGMDDPLSLIPALREHGVSVFTISAGNELSDAGKVFLSKISDETGGRFLESRTDFEALGWLFESAMILTDHAMALTSPVMNISDTAAAKNQRVRVEDNATSAVFTVLKDNPDSRINFTVVGPSNQVLTKNSPGVRVIEDDGATAFVVTNPVSGDYTLIASVQPGRPATNVQIRAAIKNLTYSIQLTTTQPPTASYPAPIRIQALTTYQGQPVINALVTSNVTRPDGTVVAVKLLDNGNPANGDDIANDGVYSALFTQFSSSGNGGYSFGYVLQTNSKTSIGDGELLGATPDPNAPTLLPGEPVPLFAREATGTVVVSNVPVLSGGILTGRVFDDVNGNKLPDAGEAGFEGVLVFPDFNNNGERDSGELFAFTDVNGVYQLELDNPGNYLIRIQVPEGENLLSDPPTADMRDNLTVTGIDFALGEPVFLPPSGPTANGKRFVVAGGAGNTLSLRDAGGNEVGTFAAFDGASGSGVRVALADFTGDGVPDMVVGTGAGVASRVRVLDGVTGKEVFSTAPFEGSFVGGVFVAAGDLNGDGVPELVITPDAGGGPRVLVLNGNGFGPLANFFWIDEDFRGGARAAVADLDGNGVGDLVVAAGVGGGPRIAGFGGQSLANAPTRLFPDFFAFDSSVRTGLFVAAGDLGGDGFGDIVVAPDVGGGPRVTTYEGRELLRGVVIPHADFLAGAAVARGGTRVAVRDLNGDGSADLIVGAGTGNRVTGYSGTQLRQAATPTTAFGFDLALDSTAGVFVG